MDWASQKHSHPLQLGLEPSSLAICVLRRTVYFHMIFALSLTLLYLQMPSFSLEVPFSMCRLISPSSMAASEQLNRAEEKHTTIMNGFTL